MGGWWPHGVLAHLYDCMILRRGLLAKLSLWPDVSGVFILFLFNTDWYIWWCACGCVWDKNLDKPPVSNSHSSSLWWWMSLMLLRERDSRRAAETFTNHVFDDTLLHRAINRIKTAMQMSGRLVASWCVSTFIWLYDTPKGFIGEAQFMAWCVRGFYSVFV